MTMTEYVPGPDEDLQGVAQRLLKGAKDPGGIHWSPRPNTHPHGGVFVLPDEEAETLIASVRAEREAETKRIEAALSAADERDSKADETGLTPEELGFPASTGDDPGAALDDDEESAEDVADEAVVDDPSTPEDEHAAAADRVAARRKAARAKAAETAAEKKSE